jgi:hypothetical protein
MHQFNNLDDIEKHQHAQSDFADDRSKKFTYNSTVILYEGTLSLEMHFLYGVHMLPLSKKAHLKM